MAHPTSATGTATRSFWWTTMRALSPSALLRATVHLLLDLPVAIVAFVASVVLGVLSLALLVVYPIALPVILAWVTGVRGLAWLERMRIRALLGVTVPAPPALANQGGWHRRLWAAATQRDTWRAFGYHLVRLPLGILSFATVVTAWALPLGLLALPVTFAAAGVPLRSVAAIGLLIVAPLIGVAVTPVVPLTVRALAHFDAAFAAALLGPSDRDRLDDRVDQLASTRSELVDIAEVERRRIERDLHDGAGQQLVSLAMTLGMAREKLATDPDDARALIDEAHAEAKQALVGLRDIVRGISPAILNDRGLGAALSAVAARSTLPLSLVVDVPERPDAAVEGIAYYLVCEAVSNAVRHADASRVHVHIARRGDSVDIEISDDGRGGANPDRGTGLRGLAGRVAAVDGDFDVTSPDGGPTTIRATLPARVAGSSAEER